MKINHFLFIKLDKNKEKKIIIEYSARKNKVKPLAPYSILKPEINSLSPSLKSKGARLVSLTNVITQIIIKGKVNKYMLIFFILRLILLKNKIEINRSNVKITS
jgi:hypothetical protein